MLPSGTYNSELSMSTVLSNRLLIVLGFFGLAVSGYLTLAHWMGAEMACIVGSGCSKIAISPYSWIPFGSQGKPGFGVPIAFPGFLTYAVLTALAVMRSMRGDSTKGSIKLGAILSGVGFLISGILMIVAFGVIKATCIWCVMSAVTMALTFLIHVSLLTRDGMPSHASPLFLGPVAVLSFGFLGYQAVVLNPKVENTGPILEELIPKNPKTFGTPGGPVTIVEFADLTCPHCRESYAELKRVLKEGRGSYEVVWRSFPLRMVPGHEMGLPAAAIGEVVAETGKFFQYVDMVVATDVKELSVEKLLGFAESLGVDPEVAKKRIADEKDPAFIRLKEDIAMGDKLGILQTPTYYIGVKGKRTYPAKQNSFHKVMDLPELKPLWSTEKSK